MQITEEHISKWKARLGLKSGPTQETYWIFTDKFLGRYEGNISEENLIDFLTMMSKNSIRTAFYAIKFFFNAAGIPLNLKVEDIASKGGVKKIREVFTIEEIKQLIATAKEHYGIAEIGYITLAIIYGLRRIELWNLNSDDISLDSKPPKLRVYTAKGGQEERIHLIPPDILEEVSDLWFALTKIKHKPVITQMNMFLDSVCAKADIRLRPRLGWHSIRRALVSQLMTTSLNPTIIRHFLRWKPREGDILLDYTIFNPEDVDTKVFEQHPFLKFFTKKQDS
ncbi:MAG TPA: hypothetical protein ENG87_02795 [Candidatus Pacearchaeota archaeon]|nr:hypothetical protein [Candidatus Pacearchaeota archaeon]